MHHNTGPNGALWLNASYVQTHTDTHRDAFCTAWHASVNPTPLPLPLPPRPIPPSLTPTGSAVPLEIHAAEASSPHGCMLIDYLSAGGRAMVGRTWARDIEKHWQWERESEANENEEEEEEVCQWKPGDVVNDKRKRRDTRGWNQKQDHTF